MRKALPQVLQQLLDKRVRLNGPPGFFDIRVSEAHGLRHTVHRVFLRLLAHTQMYAIEQDPRIVQEARRRPFSPQASCISCMSRRCARL